MITGSDTTARGQMAAQRYTDAELIAAIQQVAMRIDGKLSVLKYDHLRTLAQPSSALIIQRFGSWRNATEQANINSNTGNRVYRRQFTKADAILITKKYLASTTKPSYQDFADWLKTQPDAPSAQTCRNLAGSWQQLLTAARH